MYDENTVKNDNERNEQHILRKLRVDIPNNRVRQNSYLCQEQAILDRGIWAVGDLSNAWLIHCTQRELPVAQRPTYPCSEAMDVFSESLTVWL